MRRCSAACNSVLLTVTRVMLTDVLRAVSKRGLKGKTKYKYYNSRSSLSEFGVETREKNTSGAAAQLRKSHARAVEQAYHISRSRVHTHIYR